MDFHHWLTRVHGFKVGIERNSYRVSDLEAAWDASAKEAEKRSAEAMCEYCHTLGPPQHWNEIQTANGKPWWHPHDDIWSECQAAAIWNLQEAKLTSAGHPNG